MTLSTIVILMLMNGFAISEAFGAPRNSILFKVGTLMPLVGILSLAILIALALILHRRHVERPFSES